MRSHICYDTGLPWAASSVWESAWFAIRWRLWPELPAIQTIRARTSRRLPAFGSLLVHSAGELGWRCDLRLGASSRRRTEILGATLAGVTQGQGYVPCYVQSAPRCRRCPESMKL